VNQEKGQLSVAQAVLMTVGAMIGSAIFSLSGVTIKQSGGWASLAWLIAGLILLVYGLICANLAKFIQASGGMFLFPASLSKNKKISVTIGAISSLCYFLGCLGGTIFSAMYIGYYFGYLFPAVSPAVYPIVSIVSVLLAIGLNLLKTREASWINSLLVAFLVLILLVYIILCVASPKAEFSQIFTSSNLPSNLGQNWSSVTVAMTAYGSIVAPVFMVGKIKNSKKNLPKILIISMVVTILIYVGSILSTELSVNSLDLAQNPEMIYSPFSLALMKIGAPVWFGSILNIGAILALFTTEFVVMNLAGISISVVSKALAKNTSTKNIKKQINTKSSIIIVGLITAILSLFNNFSEIVINWGSYFNAFFVVIICITWVVVKLKMKV
jgi:amino acid transporter